MKIGIPGLVFIVFLVLKLIPGTVVYTWPWIWVFSPLWIAFLIAIGLLILAGFIALLGQIH